MTIRAMDTDDALQVAALSEQLGYPITPDLIRERFLEISRSANNGFFVAVLDGGVAGWVHVYGVHLLESPEWFAEIGGLVVDSCQRRVGVGRALMARAEGWAQARGYANVRLRSGLQRDDAHRFYEAIGYTLTKTSHLFQKALG